MIPRIAKKGRSFKGAGLYYLHDKGAQSNERVLFTHTKNLPTADPDKAIKCMAFTAMHQNEIKARAGSSGKGRKLAYPVYSYSLSWSPDQNPTRTDMIDAANESLKALGMDDHEVLMVAHTDTAHPHIHLIVNRVHPDTGLAAKLSNDKIKLSEWAEDYERRHGGLIVERRAENNRRRRNEFVKDKALSYHEYRRRRIAENLARDVNARKNLTGTQKKRRIDLYDKKEDHIEAERKTIRIRTSRHWRALYLQQKKECKVLSQRKKVTSQRLQSMLGAQAKNYLYGPHQSGTGALSQYFNDTATQTIPDNPAKTKQKQDKERRAAQRSNIRDLKDLLFDKNALRRERNRTGKLSSVFGDHSDRSKEDINQDQIQAAKSERKLHAIEKHRANLTLKRFLKNADIIHGSQDERTGRLSRLFTAQALPPVLMPAKLRRRISSLPQQDGIRAEFNEIQRQRSETELLDKKHKAQRKNLTSQIKEIVSGRIDELNLIYKDQRKDLRAIEGEERRTLESELSQNSQDRARQLADGTVYKKYRAATSQALFEQLKEVAHDITHPSRDNETRVEKTLREIGEDRQREKRQNKDKSKRKGKGRTLDRGSDFTP